MTKRTPNVHEWIAGVIDDATDLIEENGHAKRALQSHDGRLCLLGAINVAVFGVAHLTTDMQTVANFNQAKLVSDAILRAINATGSKATTVYGWNDYHKRTEQEVLDVGRSAAKMERMAAIEDA